MIMAQSPCLFASPFWFPFTPFPFPFTHLETLLVVIGSCPPWSQVARKLISPSPSPPLSKIPAPWGFPEPNVRLTKTTTRIWLTKSRTVLSYFLLEPNIFFSRGWGQGGISWSCVIHTVLRFFGQKSKDDIYYLFRSKYLLSDQG